MRYYVLIVEGDIFPVLKGPFRTKAERDCAAFRYRKRNGDDDGVYMLVVAPDGRAGVDSYSGGFLDGTWGNPCRKPVPSTSPRRK